MWSLGVKVLQPCLQLGTGFLQGTEERLVKAFATMLTVEVCYRRVLLWLTWRDVVPTDAGFRHPSEHCHTSELSVVMGHHGARHALFGNQMLQFMNNPQAR
ncbi:hypothetical protein ROA7450_03470 [Roseovarius albus]|uniref:Uncharacterized protein n=1 Tax=Roseovarius albus TaxID=1247867 RepID=A0A1X6ZZF4_9RHOB|nr:hypothetical protein ROA7450_03470 [Roseovarius albus]